jgi:hypothetical protein
MYGCCRKGQDPNTLQAGVCPGSRAWLILSVMAPPSRAQRRGQSSEHCPAPGCRCGSADPCSRPRGALCSAWPPEAKKRPGHRGVSNPQCHRSAPAPFGACNRRTTLQHIRLPQCFSKQGGRIIQPSGDFPLHRSSPAAGPSAWTSAPAAPARRRWHPARREQPSGVRRARLEDFGPRQKTPGATARKLKFSCRISPRRLPGTGPPALPWLSCLFRAAEMDSSFRSPPFLPLQSKTLELRPLATWIKSGKGPNSICWVIRLASPNRCLSAFKL